LGTVAPGDVVVKETSGGAFTWALAEVSNFTCITCPAKKKEHNFFIYFMNHKYNHLRHSHNKSTNKFTNPLQYGTQEELIPL